MSDPRAHLLDLSHRIGTRGDLAILGEGNTSIRSDATGATFWVKASGHSLATLTPAGLVECHRAHLMDVLRSGENLSDADVDAALLASRVDPTAAKPSVEAYFHAALLSLPGMSVVAHAHPNAVNPILCSARAPAFAHRRHCPDEVVCCGGRSLLLPYIDPGLALAREIFAGVRTFSEIHGKPPKVILLANHGVICPASSCEGAWAALAMTAKAASIFTTAELLGGAIPLTDASVARLDARPDEAYRRAVLGL